jgi:uncharacterized protein YjbI with pentapeptide repeats
MTKCKYVLGDFQCEEESIDSGYCIFHDENYYQLHPKEIDEAFEKKLLGKTDPLICIGYNLVNVRFEGDITKSLDFSRAIFHGDFNAINAEFTGEITDFTRAKFTKRTDFSFAKFTGEKTYFAGAEFTGWIYFTRAEFTGEKTIFAGAKFTGEKTYFAGAKFTGKETDFTGAKFTGKETYFAGAEFTGEITDFAGAKFTGKETYFTGAKFTGEKTYFAGAEFTGWINFTRAKFTGKETDFAGAKFTGKETYFTGAEFTGEITDFTGAKFTGKETDFSFAKFTGEKTIFAGAKFTGEITDFSLAKFTGKETIFAGAKFTGKETYFAGAKFTESVDFDNAIFHSHTFFTYADFGKNKITFNSSLRNVSFYETRIGNNVRFGLKTKWNKDYKIFDEIRLEQNLHDSNMLIGGIIRQYQDLRNNYEYNFNYDVAGKFFIRESEILRNYQDPDQPANDNTSKSRWKIKLGFFKLKKENEKTTNQEPKIKRKSKFQRYVSVAYIYKIVGDYGESYKKPFGILGAMFVVTGLYTAFSHHGINHFFTFDALTDGFTKALGMFVPYLDVVGTTDLLSYAIKTVALPLVGVGFIALKRRFERKYRNTTLGA